MAEFTGCTINDGRRVMPPGRFYAVAIPAEFGISRSLYVHHTIPQMCGPGVWWTVTEAESGEVAGRGPIKRAAVIDALFHIENLGPEKYEQVVKDAIARATS